VHVALNSNHPSQLCAISEALSMISISLP
jgi:hypothetical protein